MNPELENFYLNQNEPERSCLLALRSIILEQDKYITETQKYGMPCFLYRKRILCYLWTDKKTSEPYILFAKGKEINDPVLETGNRSRMKILRVNPNEDLQMEIIYRLLKQALLLYQNDKGV